MLLVAETLHAATLQLCGWLNLPDSRSRNMMHERTAMYSVVKAILVRTLAFNLERDIHALLAP